jgi:hypothetical protein
VAWALDLAREADLDGPDQSVWLDLLAADHDNFVAGLEWSLSVGAAGADAAAESALALAAALAPFWKIRGYIGLGQRWLDAALAAAGPRADPRLRAAALDGGGLLAAVRADYDAQRAYQHQSLAIWRSLGEDARIASSLGDLRSAPGPRRSSLIDSGTSSRSHQPSWMPTVSWRWPIPPERSWPRRGRQDRQLAGRPGLGGAHPGRVRRRACDV